VPFAAAADEPRDRLRRFVKRAASSRWTRCEAPGVGEQYRAGNKALVASATVHDGRVVHLVAAAT
jgi:hypothetical protein